MASAIPLLQSTPRSEDSGTLHFSNKTTQSWVKLDLHQELLVQMTSASPNTSISKKLKNSCMSTPQSTGNLAMKILDKIITKTHHRSKFLKNSNLTTSESSYSQETPTLWSPMWKPKNTSKKLGGNKPNKKLPLSTQRSLCWDGGLSTMACLWLLSTGQGIWCLLTNPMLPIKCFLISFLENDSVLAC